MENLSSYMLRFLSSTLERTVVVFVFSAGKVGILQALLSLSISSGGCVILKFLSFQEVRSL